jgi:hypothetical protein
MSNTEKLVTAIPIIAITATFIFVGSQLASGDKTPPPEATPRPLTAEEIAALPQFTAVPIDPTSPVGSTVRVKGKDFPVPVGWQIVVIQEGGTSVGLNKIGTNSRLMWDDGGKITEKSLKKEEEAEVATILAELTP